MRLRGSAQYLWLEESAGEEDYDDKTEWDDDLVLLDTIEMNLQDPDVITDALVFV